MTKRKELAAYVLEEPGHTTEWYAKLTERPVPSVRRDLRELEKRGLVSHARGSNPRRWRAPEFAPMLTLGGVASHG